MIPLDKEVLDNGLTIYFYNDKRRHSTFFQFITKFGGKTKDFIFKDKEYHIQDGVAHILEHYLVECNDEGNFLDLLGEKQMNTNAATSMDMTYFYFNAVENVEFGIKTMLNGINNVKFTTEKLEKLKNPIYQEIRGRSDNRFYHSQIQAIDNLFNNISFRSIGGNLDEVKKTTIEDLKICYEAFYQPSNQYIIVAGNFEKDKVLKIIKDFYHNDKKKYDEVNLLKIKEENTIRRKKSVVYHQTPLEYVELSFKIDISDYSSTELVDLDFYLACFFHQFFGVVSPVYKKFVNEKIISANIFYNFMIIDDYLIISIGGYTFNKKAFKDGVINTISELNDFREDYFELDKKDCVLRLILRDENIIKTILPFVTNLISYDYPYLDKVDDILKLTFKDFVEAIKKLDFTNYTVVTITNPK